MKKMQKLMVGTGKKTEAAVKLLQKYSGSLKVDGIAGPKTKGFMLGARFDKEKDILPGESKDKPTFKTSQTVNYWVGATPGYLKREAVLKEINVSLEKWSEYCSLKFKLQTKKDEDTNIQFKWRDVSREKDNDFLFDGP